MLFVKSLLCNYICSVNEWNKDGWKLYTVSFEHLLFTKERHGFNLRPLPPPRPDWSGSSVARSSPWCWPQHATSLAGCFSSGTSWSDISGTCETIRLAFNTDKQITDFTYSTNLDTILSVVPIIRLKSKLFICNLLYSFVTYTIIFFLFDSAVYGDNGFSTTFILK